MIYPLENFVGQYREQTHTLAPNEQAGTPMLLSRSLQKNYTSLPQPRRLISLMDDGKNRLDDQKRSEWVDLLKSYENNIAAITVNKHD